MDRERFEGLVEKAVENLPEEFHDKMNNIDVVVEDRPTSTQLGSVGRKRGETVLGLYEGVPLTKRGRYYGMVIPDKITIFQKPIETICKNDTKIIAEIQRVVQHEIGHHFGISDARLRELGM